MGIFDGLKNAFQPGGLHQKWMIPQSEEDLIYLFEDGSGTHLIYKHSFACGICLFSKRRIEGMMDDSPQISGWHFIDVRKHRNLSVFVANRSEVRHESPQAILFHNGRVLWHGSHSMVQPEVITNTLQNLKSSD